MDKTFSTFDMQLACSLMTLGHELQGIYREPGSKRCSFLFDKNDQLFEHKDQFWKDALMVNARDLLNNYKHLKNYIHREDV